MPTPKASVRVANEATTLPNGSVMITTVYKTSTPTPSVVFVTAPPTGSQAVQTSFGYNGSRAKLGPIIGGVVAGFVALIAIVALVWFIM